MQKGIITRHSTKLLKYFGAVGITAAAISGLSACSLLEKFDFEITISQEDANLSYLNLIGTSAASVGSRSLLASSDPLTTVSKGTTGLTKKFLGSDYTKKIINYEMVDHHWGEENAKATLKKEYKANGKTISDPLKFFLDDGDPSHDPNKPLTSEQVLNDLKVDLSTFNYLFDSIASAEIYYQKDPAKPDDPAFLHRLIIKLRDDNYWSSANGEFMAGGKERRKVKASDWLAAARIEMEASYGAPYNYMWDINSGLNNSHECIYQQKNAGELKNMLEIPACKDFFTKPDNPGSGYFADDEKNELIMTFADLNNPNNTGQSLPIGIVFSEMANVMYWPISQTFFHDKYDPGGKIFTENGYDPDNPTGIWNEKTDLSEMKQLISPFGTTSDDMFSNGPFTVTDFLPGYALDFHQNKDYWDNVNTVSDSYRIRLGAIQAGGAVISDRFRNGHQSYAEILPYSSKEFFEGTSAEKFVGALPDKARSIFLSFNTVNDYANVGELKPVDPNDPKTDYYNEELTDSAKAMTNRNFRRALNYAFDYQKFWNTALLQYSPVMSQWSEAGTSSAVTAPNEKLGDDISFQDYLYNTTYSVPTGNDKSVSSTLTSFDSKGWNDYFQNPPENFKDFRFTNPDDQLAAANYYWDKWVVEAEKMGIPEGRVSLNVVGNPTGTMSRPYLLALDQSLAKTKFGDKVTVTGKDVNDYFNSVYYQGAKGIWDIGTAGWNPDYLDPATFYSTLMPADPAFGVSKTGNWNFTMELLYLLQPGNEDELNSWLNPVTTGNNKNEATLGLLGSTSRDVAVKILDAFTMSYNDEIYGPAGEASKDATVWSNLTPDQIKQLYTGLMSINPATGNKQIGGFRGLAQSDQFWKWDNSVRLASMVGMEILIHSGSPGLSTSSNALMYGGSRLVGTSMPASGERDFQFTYDCRNASGGNPTCDDLWGA